MDADTLVHYGVPGMRWGVRKEREKAYRKKLSAISRNTSVIGTSDAKRINYRNQNLVARVTKTATVCAAQMVIPEIFNGKINRYSSMSRAQLTKEQTKKAISLAGKTAANMAINDALAKSTAKYTDSGRRVRVEKGLAFVKRRRH